MATEVKREARGGWVFNMADSPPSRLDESLHCELRFLAR